MTLKPYQVYQYKRFIGDSISISDPDYVFQGVMIMCLSFTLFGRNISIPLYPTIYCLGHESFLGQIYYKNPETDTIALVNIFAMIVLSGSAIFSILILFKH